ncbi:MAG: hypothetical protein AB7P33_17105 [Dehalococcoidia bacterium]
MSLLSSLVGKKKGTEAVERQPCSHPELAPRWQTAAAMGNRDLISHYQCCTCGTRVDKEDAIVAS